MGYTQRQGAFSIQQRTSQFFLIESAIFRPLSKGNGVRRRKGQLDQAEQKYVRYNSQHLVTWLLGQPGEKAVLIIKKK